jgi:hypothetical protein
VKRVAILQSNYIPWRGYFDLISSVDEFIIYDSAKYTKNDWRNRNVIKTPQGLHWLTIPVKYSSTRGLIAEATTSTNSWRKKHWKTLELSYGRSCHFKEVRSSIEELYLNSADENLSRINLSFITFICRFLDIGTKITSSNEFQFTGDRNNKIIEICRQAKATHYLSGPSANDYLDHARFQEAGVALEFFSYENYLPYPQLWGRFENKVSILDLLFNCGKHGINFLKGIK